MMSMIRVLRSAVRAGLAGALLMTVMACNPTASPSPTTVLNTGVQGLVLAGPTCPVERPGQSACVRPVEGATIVALDSGNREVARTTSDATGVYFLRLAPGTYRIVPQPVTGLLGAAAPEMVVVGAGAPVQLDLQYDTGIR